LEEKGRPINFHWPGTEGTREVYYLEGKGRKNLGLPLVGPSKLDLITTLIFTRLGLPKRRVQEGRIGIRRPGGTS